jgi:hypothetical protein
MAPLRSLGNINSAFDDFYARTGKDAVSPFTPPPITATGGTKSTSGIYTLHAFTSSGSLVISSGEGDVDYFVVAGGGGGGNTIGGGGGGGGVARGTISNMSPGPYTVTIGAGGGGSPSPNSAGSNGQNSVFSTIIAAIQMQHQLQLLYELNL